MIVALAQVLIAALKLRRQLCLEILALRHGGRSLSERTGQPQHSGDHLLAVHGTNRVFGHYDFGMIFRWMQRLPRMKLNPLEILCLCRHVRGLFTGSPWNTRHPSIQKRGGT